MNLTDAKTGMSRFLQSQASGQKVYRQPMFSVVNIAAFADTNGVLQPQKLSFFQTGRGKVGNGFGRALTGAETSLPSGADGVMPGGIEFIADHLGVDLFPSLPEHIKTFFTEKSFLVQRRLSHEWVCGATRYWPCAAYGNQSQAAATTVANTTLTFGVNGRVPLTRLPEGGEIYFPAKQQVDFVVETTEAINVTANGEPVSDQNPKLDEALVAVVLLGWQFEVITT
jgi:hypothetical protein